MASSALSAIGLGLLLRVSATSHYPLLGAVLFVVGFGTTSVVFGAVVAGTAGVTDDEQGVASALVNAARQIGSALGVAALLSLAAAQAGGTSTTGTAHGYRVAMAAAAVLAVVATAISAVFVHDRGARRSDPRLPRPLGRVAAVAQTAPGPSGPSLERRTGSTLPAGDDNA
jgi:predicted MFS family arabinose efflux permease